MAAIQGSPTWATGSTGEARWPSLARSAALAIASLAVVGAFAAMTESVAQAQAAQERSRSPTFPPGGMSMVYDLATPLKTDAAKKK